MFSPTGMDSVVRPGRVLWQLADRMTCLIMWAEDGARERGRGETGSPLHITPLSGPELSSVVSVNRWLTLILLSKDSLSPCYPKTGQMSLETKPDGETSWEERVWNVCFALEVNKMKIVHDECMSLIIMKKRQLALECLNGTGRGWGVFLFGKGIRA